MTEKELVSGFVVMVGRPNVGKSTLINSLVNTKVSIVSKIPQTTRHLVRGILNLDDAQIVFVDSPGIHSFKERLAQHLNVLARKSTVDAELILYVVDVTRLPGLEEERIMEYLLSQRKLTIIMVFNKVDLGKRCVNDYMDLWKKKVKDAGKSRDPMIYYMPVSARTGKNLDVLIKVIKENLPKQFPFYDRDCVTDFPDKFRVADIIREKLCWGLKQEMPHSLAVDVVEIEDKGSLVYVGAYIYVIRTSQKKIIIGKRGIFIKNIGEMSRKEIEGIFGKKVYLDLWVKVMADWQKKARILKELGYES